MFSLTTPFLLPTLHPLLFVTFSLIFGIVWQTGIFAFYPLIALVIAAMWAIICTGQYSRPLTILALCCGFTVSAYRMHAVRNEIKLIYESRQNIPFDCQGIITDIARVDHPICRQRLTINLNKLKECQSGQWQPNNMTLQIYTRWRNDLQVADIVELKDLTIKQMKNSSFQDYLIKEGITATMFMTELSCVVVERPTYSLMRWLFTLRERVLTTLKKKLSPQPFQLFASIFLGAKPVPKKELEKSKEHFNTWGVTHYLARSGLHMIIFVFVWNLLLSVVPLPFLPKQLLLIFLCILYCLLSWASVSFNRAFLSVLLYRLCVLVRVPTNFLHTLTVVCLLILINNPMQLFFLDFQLSFGLTFALALFAQFQHAIPQKY